MDRLLLLVASSRNSGHGWDTRDAVLASSPGLAFALHDVHGAEIARWPDPWFRLRPPPGGFWVWEGTIVYDGVAAPGEFRWRPPTIYELEAVAQGVDPWASTQRPVAIRLTEDDGNVAGAPFDSGAPYRLIGFFFEILRGEPRGTRRQPSAAELHLAEVLLRTHGEAAWPMVEMAACRVLQDCCRSGIAPISFLYARPFLTGFDVLGSGRLVEPSGDGPVPA